MTHARAFASVITSRVTSSDVTALTTDEEVSLKKSAFQALAQQAAGDLIGFAAHWAAFLALFGTRTCLDITGGRAEVGQGGLDCDENNFG